MLAECLVGEKFVKIEFEAEEVLFYGEDGELKFKMHHNQDWCESVYISDITLDESPAPSFLTTSGEDRIEIIFAKETEPDLPPNSEYDDSYLWTVYELETNKGSIIITWYGTSNGYYGEAPTIAKMNESGSWNYWD